MCDSENHTEICFYREGVFLFCFVPQMSLNRENSSHYATAALSVGTGDLESKQ